jgi:hypothetical protein
MKIFFDIKKGLEIQVQLHESLKQHQSKDNF